MQHPSKNISVQENNQISAMKILLLGVFCPTFPPTGAASLHVSGPSFTLVFPSAFQPPALNFTLLTEKYLLIPTDLDAEMLCGFPERGRGSTLWDTNGPGNPLSVFPIAQGHALAPTSTQNRGRCDQHCLIVLSQFYQIVL